MRKRTLVFALVLTTGVTGCASSVSKKTETFSTEVTSSTGDGACSPSGAGSTDLKKRPVFTVPTGKAPTETTVVDIVCGSGVIAGFSKGTTGMKVGGRREVIIPPKDGYGDGGPVPGGTLVFLIDLVKVT